MQTAQMMHKMMNRTMARAMVPTISAIRSFKRYKKTDLSLSTSDASDTGNHETPRSPTVSQVLQPKTRAGTGLGSSSKARA